MKERRREERQEADGFVELILENPQQRLVVGNMLDISSSGFRVCHNDLVLASGDKVRYSHSQGSGTALVMWTRVFDGGVESGLYTGVVELPRRRHNARQDHPDANWRQERAIRHDSDNRF